ncbi:peptidylprolyl isomerase [Reinekea sp. G2M2-21]|uniref:peptidylprolyl isomerase n=1 Tax=Reinekea sp. G2M2-21 TaxID=2788942 RepID=UPI0018AB6E67|nr:peptidylprolyl isomerase [Reinekea sp. G2M2-21]
MDFKPVFLLPVVFVVACSGGETIAKVGKDSISKAKFESHLAFKRINPTNVDRASSELDSYLTQTALAQAIEHQELTDNALLAAEFADIKKQMTISRYMAEYLDKAVNDVAVENYYNGHQEEFTQQIAHVAHIVFRVSTSMTDVEKQSAHQKARDVVARLAKGEAFEVLAQNMSDDVYSADKGGDLGWVSPSSIDPAFASSVLSLKEDETSDIVESQYGYHVIKLLEPLRSQVSPLSQVQGDIRYKLRQKAKIAETQRLLDSVSIVKVD